jgi:hypothetical protein
MEKRMTYAQMKRRGEMESVGNLIALILGVVLLVVIYYHMFATTQALIEIKEKKAEISVDKS